MRNAPKQIYTAGDQSLLQEGIRVSIIGTRKPTAKGKARARRLARILAERGIIVVSGLARGIDTAADVEAIAAGGRTIAVLGTPLDRFYPAENRQLQRAIMTGHLAISQIPPGTETQPEYFAQRNLLMALISHAAVVVEAGERSGTRHHARETMRLGRPLLFMRSLVEREVGWVQKALDHGAHVLAEESDLMDLLPL